MFTFACFVLFAFIVSGFNPVVESSSGAYVYEDADFISIDRIASNTLRLNMASWQALIFGIKTMFTKTFLGS